MKMTIDELVALLESLDGYGIIFEDEELVRETLEGMGYESSTTCE